MVFSVIEIDNLQGIHPSVTTCISWWCNFVIYWQLLISLLW